MKYFLTYIDILGYENRAKKEAEKTGRPVEDVRNSYIHSVEGRLEKLKKSGIIEYKKSEYSDGWFVFTNSIWKAFRCVGEVLKAKLPVEVGIGFKEFSDSYLPERSNETVLFLKNIIAEFTINYKNFYKEKYRKSPKHTFILLTEEAYEKLDSKGICFKPYKFAKYYLVDQKKFERKLKVLEFLEKIGSERTEYREIEELYVEPKNYTEIISMLEKHNIVFLIGDAEMGKTYTAVKLLFEYFKEGYEPLYIPEERYRKQWELIRHEIEVEGKVIYLEDPWGKVEFKTPESLFKEVGSFIAKVKRKKCKVIITSREKIFKEFEKRKETAENLWKYVNQLRVNVAYSKEALEEILERYIKVFEPAWSKDMELRKVAFEAVGRILRTPMSIKKLMDFSKEAKNREQLKEAIEKAGEETKITFAREIKEMFNRGEYDALVFLSFPYMEITSEVAKSCYEEILKDLGYDLVKAKTFDDLLEEFNEVEISFFGMMRYVHPSYWDAFGYALIDGGKPNNICTKIFSKVLIKLAEKDKAAKKVAEVVVENFDKLPKKVRNELLLKLAEKDKAAKKVAEVVVENFDKLPKKVRNELLLKLAEKDKAAWYVAEVVALYFYKLPKKVRNELLLKLAEKDKAAKKVAEVVARNFKVLPEEVRNLLFKLAEKDEVAWHVAKVVVENFDKLPKKVRNELLLKLAEKDKAAKKVAEVVVENFDKLPKKVRNLLFKLAEKDKAAWYVAEVVALYFYKLPKKVRNELLLKLAEKDKAAWYVAEVVARNFKVLPEEVRNELLLKLAEKDKAAWYVAEVVALYFYKLPKKVRNELLLKLAEKDKAAKKVAEVVARNFKVLPEEVRNLLFKLAEKDKAAWYVAEVVALYFYKLPKKVRNELLLKLAEKDKAAKKVAEVVARNFKVLPEEVRNLLDKLQKSLQQLIEDLAGYTFGKIDAMELISRTREKIDRNFALEILDKLSKDENDNVRTIAKALMKELK